MKNRFCLWISTAVLALITCTGGIFAAFQYANGSAESKSANVSIVLAEFSYGGNPPGYNEKHQEVINKALSEEDGINVNDENALSSPFYLCLILWVGGRDNYGYVGSMDKNIPPLEVSSEVSFIMTRPDFDPDENIYVYLSEITKAELNEMNIGDVLDNVYRVKLFKNASGKYEQGECKKGYSPVCYYEYLNYTYKYDLKGFAVFEKNIIWQEGSPA